MTDTKLIDFDFDSYNPIEKVNKKTLFQDILGDCVLMDEFRKICTSVLVNDRLTEEQTKFLEDLTYNSNNYYKFMSEIRTFYDSLVQKKISYKPSKKIKDLKPFFNALFDYLKEDGDILWLYAKEVAASDNKIKTDNEFLELFRQSFINDCMKKQPTNLGSSYTVYRTLFYQCDDEDPTVYKAERCYTYPDGTECKSKAEALYRYYDTYMRKLFTNMTTAIRNAKS